MPSKKFNSLSYYDPFSLERYTTLIQLNPKNELSHSNSGALLSRYSRSSKSMLDLINEEFTADKNRGDKFYQKVLQEFGDESIAEMSNVQVGIEGISLIGATSLTNRRIGVSFIEKSTRYVDFTPDSFYIPKKIYELGLVDEFKALCGKSYKTFRYIFKEVESIITEEYPIKDCYFFDSKQQREVIFDKLSLESDITAAEKAYKRTVTDKAFDVAGYSWLLSLKTNLGFNANCRTVDYMLKNLHSSEINELRDLGYHLHSLLSLTISPFITKSPIITGKQVITDSTVITNSTYITNDLSLLPKLSLNPLDIYHSDSSIVALYKHKITKWLQETDDWKDDLDTSVEGNTKKVNHNMNLIKNILTEIAIKSTDGTKIELKDSNIPTLVINAESLNPKVSIVNFMDEKHCIDTLCTSILYENNENLLDYDEQNIHNIDPNLRIKNIDAQKIKHGILYDMLNGNKNISDFTDPDITINKTTENTLSFNDISAYWQENAMLESSTVYMDYTNNKSTINKEQDYIIQKYIGNRKTRRDKLGRSFEFISYMFEVSSSTKVMREAKRHRIGSFLYPKVITTRNSYDNYIFPDIILKNKNLFDSYRSLIESSYEMYEKIINKGGDYHTAQYANIAGTKVNYVMNVNLRELDHFFNLRTSPQAHPEFRQVAQMMYNVLNVVHPNISRLLKFVDMDSYNLGRLRSEYKREKKLNNL